MTSILIIEDEPRNVSFLAQGLEQLGYQTLVVSNSETAVPLALSKMFDLVLLDILLPELNGVSILGNIREQRLQVPIIVMTALPSKEERLRALFLGANEYIAKPFCFDYLLGHIQSYV